jgi:hypothetical protein
MRCNFELKDGALGEIRTPNLLIRSQVLYPIELRVQFKIKTGVLILVDIESKI